MPVSQTVRLELLLNILILPLLAALGTYVLLRRPRQHTSWAFAGIAGSALVFYLANTIYAQPTLPVAVGFLWQQIETLAAHVLILAFLALAILLRRTPFVWWERLIAVAVIARAALDGAWFATVPPDPGPGCLTWAGTRALLCPGSRQFPRYRGYHRRAPGGYALPAHGPAGAGAISADGTAPLGAGGSGCMGRDAQVTNSLHRRDKNGLCVAKITAFTFPRVSQRARESAAKTA
jgi:hypothetical protein